MNVKQILGKKKERAESKFHDFHRQRIKEEVAIETKQKVNIGKNTIYVNLIDGDNEIEANIKSCCPLFRIGEIVESDSPSTGNNLQRVVKIIIGEKDIAYMLEDQEIYFDEELSPIERNPR